MEGRGAGIAGLFARGVVARRGQSHERWLGCEGAIGGAAKEQQVGLVTGDLAACLCGGGAEYQARIPETKGRTSLLAMVVQVGGLARGEQQMRLTWFGLVASLACIGRVEML